MSRVRDVLLIVVILGAACFGVFKLGMNVDSTSANLSKSDSELGQRVYHPANPGGPSHHTIKLAVLAVGGAAGMVVLLSVGSALARPRRHKTNWRAT